MKTNSPSRISRVASRARSSRPNTRRGTNPGVLDRSLIREMGELGLMGVDLPEAFGGLGAPGVTAGHHC